jgi:peptide/nickel transport system substrate-binding protein
MRRNPLKFVALVLLLALLASACSPPGGEPAAATESSAAPSAAGGEASTGGQVMLIIPEEPATLNQYLAVAAIVRQVADATTAGLTTVDADGNFAPVLAAELPTIENGGVSEDYLTVTWKLRPELKWSDGEPLTSDDVKFTWEALSNPQSGAVLSLGFDLIDHVETPDPLTAVVHYSAINQAYLQQFMFGLLPRHATGDPAEMQTWAWNRNPVSAGPYVVSEWNAGDNIIMVRNPHYYLAGQPYIDRLIFRIVPDPGAQTAMMAQGEAQVHLWPGENKAVYDATVAGKAVLAEIPGQWHMALRFNLSRPFDDDPGPQPPHPILGDLRVRQAIAQAIDYDAILNNVNPGTFPATSPFAYGWYQCDLDRPFTFDPEQARSLLAQAGWVEGPDGIRVAQGAHYAEDGTRLSLQMEGYTNFQPLQRLEEALVEMFRAVGIEVAIQNDDFSIIFGSYEEGSPRMVGNFDMLIYDDSLGIEPHASILSDYHSSGIPSAENPAGGNMYRWVNAESDAAIERAGSTVDIAERQAAYCELAELMHTDLPLISIFLFTEGYGAATNLTGYQVNMWGSLTWDVQNWRLQ